VPAPSASGSTESVDPRKDEARGHFEKALSLFDEEAWDAALVEFARSRELYPTRAATKDAALCLRRLHRFDEALDMFEALLRDFPNLPREDREIAEREIRDMAALVGHIELRVGEPGATVVVDGRGRGTMPLAPVRVPAGTRVVRVTKDGFVPFESQVAVAGAQTASVEVHLAPLTQGGRLHVAEQSGKAVDVRVDGLVVGKTPWEGTLPVGDHVVVLVGDGDTGTPPVAAPVRLNEITPLTLAVEELGASLRIEPKPEVANVAVDGVVVGRGLWEGRLRPGAHRLELASDGFLPTTRDVTIAPGERQVAAIELERDPRATLTFREAEANRQAWLKHRGLELSYEVRGYGFFLLTPHVPLKLGTVVAGDNPSSGPYAYSAVDPESDFGGGGGGGIGVRVALLDLLLPDASVGSRWSGIRIGTGVDIGVGYWFTADQIVTTSVTDPANHETTTKYKDGDWSPGFLFNIPLTLGYQLGLGSFTGPGWHGVVLGLAYTPTLSIIQATQFDAHTNLNLAGFEASFDFIDKPLSPTETVANTRVFVYMLPPVGSAPFVASIGGGAVWY
jgi:hypothetical protein